MSEQANDYLLNINHWPSPNFGPRRDGLKPECVILHYTAMPDALGALKRLSDPEAEVSAHWLIDRNGECFNLVSEEMRAWHSGAGSWRGSDDMNSRSIGIELVNLGDEPFPEPQMFSLESLLKDILERWQISARNVIGHSDMAPGRKQDPGSRFDWGRLARQGLALGPIHEHSDLDSAGFFEILARIGYPQASETALLTSFRARFNPWKAGALDEEDLKLARAIAALDQRNPAS